jgi:hypothetical protein
MRPKPTPQAIAAAQRLIRQQTGQSGWRYVSGRWVLTVIDPTTGVPRSVRATIQAAQFNAILAYFQTIYPPAPRGAGGGSGGGGGGSSSGAGGGGVGGAVASAASGAGGALVRGLRGVASAPGAIAAPLQSAVSAISGVIGSLVRAFKWITSEANSFARTMATLHDNNGLSSKQGYDLTSRNSVLGISAERTAQIYGDSSMNPVLAGARGRAMGTGSYTDPDYYAKLSERYNSIAKSGPMGKYRANAWLDAEQGGRASDEVRHLANLKPQQIREQVAYGKNVQSQMGISPEVLRKYSEEIPMATQRIAFAIEQAKIKLAVELAPFIERTFGGIATYIGKNSGKIAAAIQAGVGFLVEKVPPLLMTFGILTLKVLSAFLRGLAAFAAGIAANALPILQVFNIFVTALQQFGNLIMGVAKVVGDVVASIPQPIKDAAAANPLAAVGVAMVGNQVIKAGAGAAVRGLVGGAVGAGGGALGTAGAVVGGGLAVGIGTGYMLDQGAASIGLLNPEQSFLDRQKRGWGVVRDIVTLNPGHYDEQEEIAAAEVQRKERANKWITDHPDAVTNPKKYGYSDKEVASMYKVAGAPMPNTQAQVGASQADLSAYGQNKIVTAENVKILQDLGKNGAATFTAGADIADQGAATLEGYKKDYPDLLKEIKGLKETTEKGHNKIVDAVNASSANGDGGSVLNALKKGIARDAYLAATR